MSSERMTTPEVASQSSNLALVEVINELASDDAFAEYLSDLIRQLEAVEGQTTFYVREQQVHHLRTQGELTQDYTEIREIYDQKDRIEQDLRNNAEYRRYVSLKGRIEELTRYSEYTVVASEPLAEVLVSSLSDAIGVNDFERLAPFVNFKENTHEAWQYIPDQSIRAYLDMLHFVDTSRMFLRGNMVRVQADEDENIPVPLSLFIHAAGFESWKGRPGYNKKSWSSREYGNGGSKSIDTIKHYAALSTDLPAVEGVNVYTQPNGFIFADNGAGDSHRIGAAFLRGQKQITAENVTFVRLTENYL